MSMKIASLFLFVCELIHPMRGWEPWSSGYGKRLTFEGRGFKSWHRILDGHFSHIFVVKFVMCKYNQ